MPKRKLTASFNEIAQEKGLARSWRCGEHSDWTLQLGQEEYPVHKIIVSTGDHASTFLAASFRKHCGKDDRTDLTELVPRRCWQHFEEVLDFMYSGTIELSAANWGPIVKIADLLQVGSLFRRCVEVGSDLIVVGSAPRIVSDVVDLQPGGGLPPEVVQIALDVIAPNFQNYKPKELAFLPLTVFQQLLKRDDLEVPNEDYVFDFILKVSPELAKEDRAQLWKCCRLQELSREACLQVAMIDEIPKEAVVWAMSRKMPSSSPRSVVAQRVAHPYWTSAGGDAKGWIDTGSARGRSLSFLVPNPTCFAHKKQIRSPAQQLCEKFKWRLLVFPLGTESTGNPKQLAAFVELVPEAGVPPSWCYKSVRYSITLVNWSDESRNMTKQHTFDFCASEVDNGWHRGWLPPDTMTCAQGWLNDQGELGFRAKVCIRNATLQGCDPGAS